MIAKGKFDSDDIRKLQSADVFLFDVDDTLYPMDCGLHEVIKRKICDHANAMATQDKSWQDLIDSNYRAGILAQPEARSVGLDRFFPMIIQKVYRDGGDAGLHDT